jgi:hypothetical protein
MGYILVFFILIVFTILVSLSFAGNSDGSVHIDGDSDVTKSAGRDYWDDNHIHTDYNV